MRASLGLFLFLSACSPSQPQRAVLEEAGSSTAAAAGHDAGSDLALPVPGIEGIQFINSVAECTSLKPERLLALGSVVVATLSVRSIKSRAECGCMSSVLAYHVFEKIDLPEDGRDVGLNEEYERVYGTIEVRTEDRELSLVVATDRRHYLNLPLTLKVHCKGPD